MCLCEGCGKEFPIDLISQCACGIPYCIETCYPLHVYVCDEALQILTDEFDKQT